MASLRRGELLQYKSEFYGRYYPKLPKVPFATDFRYMDSTNKASQNAWALLAAGHPLDVTGGCKKKFVILCAKLVEVVHPRIEHVRCTYIQCFISDPYVNGETIDGWVRDRWVEPLTELETYGEEEKAAMREVYRKLKEHGPSKPQSPLELFREMKKEWPG
jgi:hypothetical protein